MRALHHLEPFRIAHPTSGWGDERNGAFVLRLPGTRLTFQIIASSGAGWDHVSISTAERCPKWDEMQQIKELFFEDDEAAMQLHPTKGNYVNQYPYCLHLWRPHHQRIPLPDKMMV